MLSLALVLAGSLAVDVKADIVYKRVASQELRLDLYLPKEPLARPVPTVVVIHGGAWMGGKRQDMASLATAIAQQGMAAASVQYRLAPRDKWPAMLEDCQDAVRFLRAGAGQWGLDPKRFGATGGSAGGHLALMLGFADGPMSLPSSRVSVVFNIFGPTDLSKDFPVEAANFVSQAVLGKPYKDAMTEIELFSPIRYVDRTSAPVFTIHGTADTTVPVRQAYRLDEALTKAGVEHQLRIVLGMEHDVDMSNQTVAKGMADGVAFLKRHLRPR